MSRPQRAHYAKERAQLQQLSLDNHLAGDADTSDNQPQPLFTINAQKLAKQVPNVEAVDIIPETASKDTAATKADKANNTQSNQQKSDATQAAKATQDQPTEQQAKPVSKNAPQDTALVAKKQAVPAKRRRRMPSSEQSLKEQQSEQQNSSDIDSAHQQNNAAQTKSSAKKKQDDEAHSNDRPSKNTGKAGEQHSEAAPRKRRRKQESTQQAQEEQPATQSTDAANSDITKVAKAVVSGERVPAVRRRRQPSSTLSIAEREVIEQQIAQQVLEA